MDRNEVEVHKLAKKERGQYPAILTEQAWSIKDLLYGIRHQKSEKFFLRDKARNRERPITALTGFGSSCPLTELPI